MNLRTVTIICMALMPIMVVVILLIVSEIEKSHLETCEEDEICVRYCCDHQLSCEHDIKLQEIEKELKQTYKILGGRTCNEFYRFERHEFGFFNNGFLSDSGFEVPWNDYCIDILNDNLIAKMCFPYDFAAVVKETYPFFILISIPFLLITFFVYGFIKALRNLHGKCLMAYAFSLTVMYITLVTIKVSETKLANDYPATCVTVGYIFIASVFCCFFWLNIMCYDIFRTFRTGLKNENITQFIIYCLYAFGIPFIIVLMMFMLNNYELIPNDFNNGIGRNSCTVRSSNDTSDEGSGDHVKVLQLIYIYGPIMILLGINVTFYGVTAWKIFRVQMQTQKICKEGDSRRHSKKDSNDNRTRFLLYLRLSVVMGVPWIFEVCSWLHGGSILLFIASIFNCLQGFVVFITFVWNPKVTKQLQRKYSKVSISFRKREQPPIKSDSSATAATKVNIVYSESSAQQ